MRVQASATRQCQWQAPLMIAEARVPVRPRSTVPVGRRRRLREGLPDPIRGPEGDLPVASLGAPRPASQRRGGAPGCVLGSGCYHCASPPARTRSTDGRTHDRRDPDEHRRDHPCSRGPATGDRPGRCHVVFARARGAVAGPRSRGHRGGVEARDSRPGRGWVGRRVGPAGSPRAAIPATGARRARPPHGARRARAGRVRGARAGVDAPLQRGGPRRLDPEDPGDPGRRRPLRHVPRRGRPAHGRLRGIRRVRRAVRRAVRPPLLPGAVLPLPAAGRVPLHRQAGRGRPRMGLQEQRGHAARAGAGVDARRPGLPDLPGGAASRRQRSRSPAHRQPLHAGDARAHGGRARRAPLHRVGLGHLSR